MDYLTDWGRHKWPPFSGRHFQLHFLEWKCLNAIKISLKFVPRGPIIIIPALVQIMTWRRPGDKPLSELMMTSLLTHICVTSPQWVNPKCRQSETWWRHQMETFSALLPFVRGNSPVPDEFPAQRPVTRSFDAFFDLCLNKRLSKQSWGWWFETLSRPLWRHCNDFARHVCVFVYFSRRHDDAMIS